MKTKLHSLFIVPALLAGIHSAPAKLTLGIALTNHQVILFWSSNDTGYVLQSNTNMESTNWLYATDAVSVSYGSNIAMTVPNASKARFFRLISAPTTTADGMALIPAGSFTIGNSIGDSDIFDAIPTNVYVSGFYMDTNLVIYSQWQSVYNWATNNGYGFDDAGSGKATNHPVQTVEWYDCVKWCNARSQQAGLTPVYYADTNLTEVYTNGDTDAVYAKWTASGYRLPTEAEWEKAARGGLSGQRFPLGDTIFESQANYLGDTNDYSYDLGPDGYNINYDDGAYPYTSPAGSFAANGYGLNDMAGDLEEWCWDWYAGLPYPAGSPYLGGSDPHGPATGSNRVLRGGDWGVTAYYMRSAYRKFNSPFTTSSGFGFRSVRGL